MSGEILPICEKLLAVENITNRRQGLTQICRVPVNPDGPEAADLISRLVKTLTKAREAVASLDEDALGMGSCVVDFQDGREEPYPLRDELLAEIDAALNQVRQP